MTEEEVQKLAEELVPQTDKAGEKLERNTKWADRIVAAMYVVGTLLVLASG